MDIFKYLFAMSQGENKVKQTVAKALSEKLQTEVDKNKLVEAIDGIDVGSVVHATFLKNGIVLKSEIYDGEIKDYKYQNNTSLVSIDLPNSTNLASYIAQSCLSLLQFKAANVATVGNGICYDCVSLTSIYLPNVTNTGNYLARNCISLPKVDFPSVCDIGNSAFQNCVSLKIIKLGASQVTTLANTNAFQNTPIAKGTGYIYVPDDLVEDYKVATNWSVYADQIKPMSEYVEEEE